MDQPSPVILKVFVCEYPKLIIETTDGFRYYSDASLMSNVYCFPKDLKDWSKVTIDSYGLGLIWSTRFEMHIDQVIGLSFKSERILQSQAG